MGKRSSFDRIPRDKYPTPQAGVLPLLPHLTPGQRFAEPCAGNGQLVDFLVAAGMVNAGAWDIEPERADIAKADALKKVVGNIDLYITNPPWKREILHPLIVHLSNQAPTWLLFDSDWKDTVQAAPFLPRCRKIVAVGRLKWIPGTKHTGKENCSWYLFDNRPYAGGGPIFYGR